ncbi:hypothetical protein ACQP1V_36145 [Microtetraspora malaysiensis]|uniref:hypothetical protein n=1 Tax=Microtetraspora malaysiensis TaxID=161358 RepID=UPI003D906B81
MRDPNERAIDAPDPIETDAKERRRLLSRLWPSRWRRIAPVKPPRPVPAPVRSRWAIVGVGVLGALVLAIVAVGLHTALGPLRDTALAAHIEPAAARLYWIGVDGLIVIAIIAAMILRHDPTARRYALTIVGLFTVASGVLQYLHGLGWTTPNPVSGVMPPLPWGVVAVVAALVIGTIFCGTHLFVYVLRQLFPRVLADRSGTPTEEPSGDRMEDEPPAEGPDPNEVARLVYAACLDAGVKLSRAKLAEVGQISERQAGYVKTDVEIERVEAARAAMQVPSINGKALVLNGSGSGATP